VNNNGPVECWRIAASKHCYRPLPFGQGGRSARRRRLVKTVGSKYEFHDM
jgi:hypothetical protein